MFCAPEFRGAICLSALVRRVRSIRASGVGAPWDCSAACSRLSRRARKRELRSIDCSHIKLHQDGSNPRGGQAAQAIGRTKGGLNTKLAAIVERGGRAVALGLAEGQRHDLLAVESLLGCLRWRWGVGDKGFAADTFRTRLRRQGTRVCIPPQSLRRCPAAFHRGYYRWRHKIENFFCRIKRHRRISTRFEKLTVTFLAFVQFAAVLDWLTHRFWGEVSCDPRRCPVHRLDFCGKSRILRHARNNTAQHR